MCSRKPRYCDGGGGCGRKAVWVGGSAAGHCKVSLRRSCGDAAPYDLVVFIVVETDSRLCEAPVEAQGEKAEAFSRALVKSCKRLGINAAEPSCREPCAAPTAAASSALSASSSSMAPPECSPLDGPRCPRLWRLMGAQKAARTRMARRE